MIAGLDALDARADLFDDRAALMTEHGGKQSFRVLARQRECIGVADAGGDVSQQYLAFLRAVKVDLLDFQRLACFPGDCGTRLHA